MDTNRLVKQIYTSFLDRVRDASLVLLDPASRYRSLLVAQLMGDPESQVFFYAMGPDDVNVRSFLAGITHDLASQHATFGRHLNQIHFESDETLSSEVLLQAFVADLGELSDRPFWLVLDEYDRTDAADDIQAFVEQVALRAPRHCTMLISSRTLPRLPWIALIAQRKAVMLRDDQVVSQDFYGLPKAGQVHLDVTAFGPGFVQINGTPVDTWEGHLPRLLFFLALDRPVVTRAEICAAFWPDLQNDQAVNVFHVTKRRLHKALDFDVLVHDDGYYHLNPNVGVTYDLNAFVSALVRGRARETSDKAAAWQEAIDLYRGPFLQGHTDQWIVRRRAEYQIGYLEALSEMARIRLEEGRHDQALALLQRAIGENDRYEPVHRQIMQLYAALGRRSEVAAHFQRLVDQLKADGVQPEPETRALYTQIMSS